MVYKGIRTTEQKLRTTERELHKAVVRGIYSQNKPSPQNDPLFGVFGMHGIAVSELVKNRNLNTHIDHRCAEDLMRKANIYTMHSLLQFSEEDLKTIGIREYQTITPCLNALTDQHRTQHSPHNSLRLGMTGDEIEAFCRQPSIAFLKKFPHFHTKDSTVDAQGERVDIRSNMLDIPRGYTAFKFIVPSYQQRFLRRCNEAIKRLKERGIDPASLLPTNNRTYYEPDIHLIHHYDKTSGVKVYPVAMNFSALHLLQAIAKHYPDIITGIANDKNIQELERKAAANDPKPQVRAVNERNHRLDQKSAFKAAQAQEKWGAQARPGASWREKGAASPPPHGRHR